MERRRLVEDAAWSESADRHRDFFRSATHDDVRSLVCKELADDELVGVVGCGEARRRRPVDPGQVVSGDVAARACDVGAAAAANAPDAPEGEADHAPARDEGEDAGRHR